MQKFFIGFVCLLVSSLALAQKKSFDLKMELVLNGQATSRPRMIVNEGEKAMITEESNGQKNFIEVVATEVGSSDPQSAILMKFVVGKIAADGSRIVISTPVISALPNEKGQISIVNENEEVDLSLSVVAKKVSQHSHQE